MSKICTSLEQSKKLIELGIDVNTADMVWIKDYLGYDENGHHKFGEYSLYGNMLVPMYGQDSIKAWSLSSLLELLGDSVNIFKRTIECRIETPYHLVDKAWCPLDAAFEMVCWLKENGKL